MANDQQDTSEESRLTTRLKDGDHSAFEEIFYNYCRPLKAFALQELKSEALAEDAVQETFCKLWLNRKKLNSNLSLRGFLFTCLKNHILNAIRTHKNEILKNYRFASQQPQPTNSTEHEVIGQEIQHNVRQFISRLPKLKRDIIQLSLYQGLSHEQIAQQLNVSATTVKIYLSQSSRQLRSLISLRSAKIVAFALFNLLP